MSNKEKQPTKEAIKQKSSQWPNEKSAASNEPQTKFSKKLLMTPINEIQFILIHSSQISLIFKRIKKFMVLVQ